MHLHPKLEKRSARVSRKRLRKGGEQPGCRLHQDDARARGLDRSELAVEAVSREFGDRAGEFHTRRPTADNDESKPPAAHFRILAVLRLLESDQKPTADIGRILQPLKAWSKGRPIVAAEIAVLCAGRQHQVVVANAAMTEQHLPRCGRNGRNAAEDNPYVRLLAKHAADRCCNVGRRQAGGCDLIEQRLE